MTSSAIAELETPSRVACDLLDHVTVITRKSSANKPAEKPERFASSSTYGLAER
jgi:hypothetical protein